MAIGLRGKIALLYLLSVVVIIGAVIGLSVRNLTNAINSEYRDKGVAIVHTFDALYGALNLIADSELTQKHIDNLMALNPNIFKMSLYTPVGDKIVRTASSNKNQIGEEAGPDDAEPIRTDSIVFNDGVYEGQPLVEVLAPLHAGGKPVAAIGVYLRLAPRDEAIQRETLSTIVIGSGAGLVLLSILYLSLNRLLLMPLTSLKNSALAISRGSLTTRLSLGRRDELGALATEFNVMANALQRREDENRLLQEQLQEKYQLAQSQAITDVITGLYNHRCFQESCVKELERAHRFDNPLTLLFMDIDHFKALNDAHGHQYGDYVLRELASLLKAEVREIDSVARYGGEEFAVLLPVTDRHGGYLAAERIRQTIADHPFGGDLNSRRVTVSIGVASFPEDGLSREELTAKADEAMYYAKQLGRNQVRLYCEITEPAKGKGSSFPGGGSSEPFVNL